MSKTIINGIDVSECKHLKIDRIKKPICRSGGCTRVYRSCLCEGNENCYYKQLKRLQEENKRLQMLSCANCDEKYLSPEGAELYEKNVQLQEENKELKEKIDIYENSIIANHDRAVGKRLMEVLQALEEIREMINEQKPPLDKVISQSEFTLERLCVYEEKYIKVVDKINEVLK